MELPERLLQRAQQFKAQNPCFQSFGPFDRGVLELFPRPEVAQRDLLAVIFNAGDALSVRLHEERVSNRHE